MSDQTLYRKLPMSGGGYPKKFRKKPVVIEALRWTGINAASVLHFVGPDHCRVVDAEVWIATLEGTMTARVGDWIIKGVQGEYYPCKPDIFEATYERVTNDE